jgi:peptide/nickel transport system permease protein
VTTYALRRLLIAIPTLLVISLVVFSVLALAPGDPLSNLAGSTDIPFEVRENIRRQFGLDQPIYVRYFKWLAAYVQGDWGYSFGSRIPASTLIMMRIPTTLWVIGLAYLIAVIIAIPLGVLTAARQYTWFDHLFTGISFVGFSLPTFFTGVLLIITFSVTLRWFPMVYNQQVTDPIEWIKQAIMPIAVLALLQAATRARPAPKGLRSAWSSPGTSCATPWCLS